MDKRIITLIFCFLTSFAFSQPVFERSKSSANVTIQDARLFTQLAFKMPVYRDTTEANSTHNLDSAGMQIYTMSDRAVWIREIPPRIWTKLISIVDNTTTYYGIDSITYSAPNNICQWQSGVSLCYNIIGQGNPAQGIDSIHVYNNSFCQFKNGDSVCYTITGNVLQTTIDSVTVVNGNLCSWFNGFSTCYPISPTPPLASVLDTIYFTAPPFRLIDSKTVTIDSSGLSTDGYVTAYNHTVWTNKQDTGISWNKGGNTLSSGERRFGSFDSSSVYLMANNLTIARLDSQSRSLIMVVPTTTPFTGSTRIKFLGVLGTGVEQEIGNILSEPGSNISGSNLKINSFGGMEINLASGGLLIQGPNSSILGGDGLKLYTNNTSKGIKIGNQFRQINGNLLEIYGLSIDLSNTKNYFVLDKQGNGAMRDSVTTIDIDSSAIMNFVSTTKGILIPRMTTAQRVAIPSPAEGLEVYDLDFHAKFTWDGTRWTGYRYNGTHFQGYTLLTGWINLN